MSRELVIGDIHGGLRALEQVLERAAVTTDDILIFLGDYVDGWADSFQVIEYLVELRKTHNCVFIQGNHDLWCYDWLRSGIPTVLGVDENWSNSRGGITTIKSYQNAMANTDTHLAFFRNLNFYYDKSASNRVYIHGGYTQGGGVRFENPTKNLWWDRTLLSLAQTHESKFGNIKHKENGNYDKFYPKILKVYNEIYIGHTATLLSGSDKPMFVCNVINVDTGCGHREGKLTILDVETKEFWQSDRLGDLYPEDPHYYFH